MPQIANSQIIFSMSLFIYYLCIYLLLLAKTVRARDGVIYHILSTKMSIDYSVNCRLIEPN